MNKVLVTCKQMQEYLSCNEVRGFEFVCPELLGQSFSSEQMVKLTKGYEFLIAGDDELDETFFQATKTLKLVIRWGVGIDSVDMTAALEAGVKVANTPGVFNSDVAELALCYMLMLSRRVLEVHQSVERGRWSKSQGESLSGKRLGIFGYGGIGQTLGLLGQAFDMEIHACDPLIASPALEFVNLHANIGSLAGSSDFLALTAPLTSETRHAVNGEFFQRLPHSIYLVNVSRGAIIDEDCIPQAFREGSLLGFASDVFETEPLPKDSPLRQIEGIIFGSHNASNTREGVRRASEACLSSLMQFLNSN